MFIPQQTCRCPLLLSSGLGTEDTGETWTLGSSCYSRLGGGWGRVNTRSRIVLGTHAVTKEKSRGWGAGWGAHRGGQSRLRRGAGSLGNQHLRASQAERSKQARGRAASAGLGGTRRLPLCLLTEQMWAQPPLLGCFSGSPWLPFPGSKALLGHTHTTPLNFCPELLTPRGLWLESPADAPVGCGLRNLMTSRVWGLHADLTVIPPG